MRSASSMTTSGAPLPAETAVWNLSYSSPPAPAFVQQTCTSSCALLKLSTTSSMLGYHAHIVTTGASVFTSLFVHVALLLSPPPPPVPPSEQATRAPATTRVTAAAIDFLVFINRFLSGDIPVGANVAPRHVLDATRVPGIVAREFLTLYFQRCRKTIANVLPDVKEILASSANLDSNEKNRRERRWARRSMTS